MSALLLPADIAEERATARAYDVAEADLLREFYKRWEVLHGITNDQLHRKAKEEAAQSLVDQAHILRRLYAH